MNVTDSMSAKRVSEFTSEALQSFQNVLDTNLDPRFPEKIAATINKLMVKTGSCILMPGKNVPHLCRYGMVLLQNHRNVQDIYFPLFHHLGEIAGNGDPLLFCIIAHDPPGLLFEWEYFFDRWRSGEISIPNTTRCDMENTDGQVRRQLKIIRKNRAKEDAKEMKRRKKEGL